MRTLDDTELELASGGEWDFTVKIAGFEFHIGGEETVQDMAGAVADIGSSAYWIAREGMTDFFEALGAAAYHSPCWNI
jgi:hypothetical protein